MDYWIWVPPVAGIFGSVLGTWLYQLIIGLQWEPLKASKNGDLTLDEKTLMQRMLSVFSFVIFRFWFSLQFIVVSYTSLLKYLCVFESRKKLAQVWAVRLTNFLPCSDGFVLRTPPFCTTESDRIMENRDALFGRRNLGLGSQTPNNQHFTNVIWRTLTIY